MRPFPPSLPDFVPEGHPAHFVREPVRRDPDLPAIPDTYGEERGCPPYHTRIDEFRRRHREAPGGLLGQIEEAGGFRRFPLRGLEKVRGEGSLVRRPTTS